MPGVTDGPKSAPSSLIRYVARPWKDFVSCEPPNQNNWGIKIKGLAIAIQFSLNLILKMLVVGSKDEKRLPIY